MSDIIERVARTLCIADGHDPDGHFEFMTEADQNAGKRWTWYISRARTAIEAMRQPTQEMKNAVRLVGGAQALAYGLAAWPTMIDAALKEKP